jgi:hypothetical protein
MNAPNLSSMIENGLAPLQELAPLREVESFTSAAVPASKITGGVPLGVRGALAFIAHALTESPALASTFL